MNIIKIFRRKMLIDFLRIFRMRNIHNYKKNFVEKKYIFKYHNI